MPCMLATSNGETATVGVRMALIFLVGVDVNSTSCEKMKNKHLKCRAVPDHEFTGYPVQPYLNETGWIIFVTSQHQHTFRIHLTTLVSILFNLLLVIKLYTYITNVDWRRKFARFSNSGECKMHTWRKFWASSSILIFKGASSWYSKERRSNWKIQVSPSFSMCRYPTPLPHQIFHSRWGPGRFLCMEDGFLYGF